MASKKSEYWDGRYAQRHGQSIDTDDQTVEYVVAKLQIALEAFVGRSGSTLPLEDVDRLTNAYEALDSLGWHLPKIEAWACYTHSTFSNSSHNSVWSAHLDEGTARKWLPFWQERYADRTDYQWHVGLIPVSIYDVIHPEQTPERHMQRMGPR